MRRVALVVMAVACVACGSRKRLARERMEWMECRRLAEEWMAVVNRAREDCLTIRVTGNRPCRKSPNTYTCFCIIRRLPQPDPKTAERNTGTAPSAAGIIPTPRRKTRYRKRIYPFPQQVTITNTKSLCRLARKRGMPNMCAAPAATGMKRTVPALSLRGTHSANGRR